MAIGVPITAAALFDTIFVNVAITSIRPLNRTTGEVSPTKANSICAKYSAPPVFNNAIPSARLATTIKIT